MFAAENGHLELVKYLKERSADINALNNVMSLLCFRVIFNLFRQVYCVIIIEQFCHFYNLMNYSVVLIIFFAFKI